MPIDALLWVVMFMAALWMRYDFSVEEVFTTLGTSRFYVVLLGVVAFSWAAGWLAGLYRGRFIPGSLLETSVLVVVFAGASLVVFAGHLVGESFVGVPRSTALVAGAFTILAALVLRSLVRRKELFGAGAAAGAEPVLVFGAGDGGRQLVGQLRRSSVSRFRPVAILDDDPAKQGLVVDGVRVRGTREHIAHFAHKLGAGTLLVAVPSLPGDELVDIRDRAEEAGLHVLVLPPIDSMMKARVAVDELRGINVTDLLGRAPARLNQTQIAEYIRGKRIMVTGAGGSIGSELCRQLVRFRPGELMMLDRDESGLHAVQLSIQDQAMLDGEDTILASIRDREAIAEIFAKRKPQIVFHAAALKHMPLLEHYPLEALKTNVVGTLNLLDAAEASGVETFVNISTDKAASPSTSLGTSKRIAERLTAARAATAHNAKYASVRFGNVLGSRGSVLTVFEKQIKDGGPVTVTDPDVTRYFMTIPEACQLVLQAAVVGDSGDTLVLDMGEPVRIADVARTLIQQSGKDIEIVYTGLRENEKAAEELFDKTEVPIAGKKHEALSQVRVPPLDLAPEELACLEEHEIARRWMEVHANPSTPIITAR
ncbi:nucleoside-diphosphate sugar epimerase/dehydratase [Dietzia natronolimnaea]|nr:nucleoside-diphosphate sugar epimerase/dehydratase [Dietzia natronolimnaea]